MPGCWGGGRQRWWPWQRLVAVAAVWGSRCAGTRLRQRVLGWQEGSRPGVRAGCNAGHVQPQSPPGCCCKGTCRAFLPQASQLGLSVPLSMCQCRRSVFNFFDAAAPTQPLQHRCGCAIPQLSCLHQHLTKHSCLRKRLQPLGREQLQPPSPTPGCPATTSQGFTHWQVSGSHHFANSGCCLQLLPITLSVDGGTSPLPSHQPASFFRSPAPAQPGPGQRAKPACELSCLGAGFRCNFPSSKSPLHTSSLHLQLIRQKGQHRSKSHEASLMLGVILSTLVPCRDNRSSQLLQSQASSDHSDDMSDSCRNTSPHL